MDRKKLKYKDVISRGKSKPKNKKKLIPRKIHPLHANHTKYKKCKRKFINDFEHFQTKRQKLSMSPKNNFSEISDDDETDDIQKLRDSFNGNLNKSIFAIDSSDSEGDVIQGIGDTNLNEKLNYNLEDNLIDNSSDDSLLDEKENTNQIRNKTENALKNVKKSDKIKDQIINEHEAETQSGSEIDSLEDPFIKHLSNDLHDSVLESLQNNPVLFNNHTECWPELGKLLFQIPKHSKVNENMNAAINMSETDIYTSQCEIPKRIDVKSMKLDDLFLRKEILNNLKKSMVEESKYVLSSLQAEIFSIINNYQDLYYSGRTFANAEQIRFIYCIHVANHILKTRNKVVSHNARLSENCEVPEEFRDQGLVRPKVLIILPFKDAAYKTIQMLINILVPNDKGNVVNKKRFIDDYTGNELTLPKKNPKPEDYERIFQGNTSDDFRIGVTVTKKSLKLYADFYSSDIIVASPLGLRTIIGAEGEHGRDYDFLASIELLILDQTEIFLMQNWDHIFHILNHMHLQPKAPHGTDFSRVRTWSLNGWAKYYRQTLIFSSLILPEINAIFNRRCLNYAGKVKVTNQTEYGCISQVFVQMPHVFYRFDAQNTVELSDNRFNFFVNKILPQQKETLMRQTLIFIPNYFDYVRIRNYFKKEDLGFVQICEYSKEGKVARARDMFYHGDAHFLLYTERYHFFNRKYIKGIRHLVFYQPPYCPRFYYEMCNLMQMANMNKKNENTSNMTVTTIYSKYDIHQLSSIVGLERATKMLQSHRNVHMMVTGID